MNSHEQLYIHIYICMQNHNDDTIKTSETVLFEKYTPHFIERVVCERALETEQNCNILTSTPMALTAFLSRSPELLNQRPGGPASLGAGFLYRILSPTDWTSCAPSYIIVWYPPSCERHKLHSFNPSTVKVIFGYSLTRCTCYLRWCIFYFDSPARSEVNIQHIYTFEQLFSCNYLFLCKEFWFNTNFKNVENWNCFCSGIYISQMGIFAVKILMVKTRRFHKRNNCLILLEQRTIHIIQI